MAPGKVENEIILCEKCKNNVSDSEKGQFCDGFCRSWFHAGCVDINDKNYRKICHLSDKVLCLCKRCTRRMDSTKSYAHHVNKYFNLHDLMGNLSKMVKGLSSDKIQITKRLDSVILHNAEVEGYVKGSKPDTSYKRNLETAAAPSVSCRVKVNDHNLKISTTKIAINKLNRKIKQTKIPFFQILLQRPR